MPTRPKHACNYPGCTVLVSGRYCDRHTKAVRDQYEGQRETATERGYDARWARVRRMKLARDPLCERCIAKGATVNRAELVHHKDRNPKNNNEANLESLCHWCHDWEHRGERWKLR